MHSRAALDRANTINHVLDAVNRPLGPPLITIVGPCGIGLSTTLEQICTTLRKRGTHVTTVQFTQGSSDLPGPFGSPGLPNASELLSQGTTVLAIDDAQWIDTETLGQLESLIRKLVGTRARCVCAVRLTATPEAGSASQLVLSQLVREGLAEIVNLRPLTTAEVTDLIIERFNAKPVPQLVRHLRRLTRNRPRALDAALDAYRHMNAIRVVDRHVYLAQRDATPTLPDNHDLPLYVRRMGHQAWSVAKAMAVLNPLGDVAAHLVAQTTGIAEPEVSEALNLLRARGILRYLPGRRRWAFQLPLTEAVLTGQLGPYERRRLAKAAVTALWHGQAFCDDPNYLADQLVNAGRMVDPDRARTCLLTRAGVAIRHTEDHLERWLLAAAELAPDRSQRANTLVDHAIVCMLQGKSTQCLQTTDTLLYDLPDQLSPELLQEVHLAHLRALHATGDFATTEQIARGEVWPWPDSPFDQAITRVAAFYTLGQWREVRKLLNETTVDWRDRATARYRADLFGSLAGLWLGQHDQFDRLVTMLPQWRHHGGHHCEQVNLYIGALLTIGDLNTAERLLAEQDRPASQLSLAEHAVLAARRGRCDQALELTRRCIVGGPSFGYGPCQVSMIQTATVILLARGRIARARDLLSGAQSAQPVLPHLLAGPEAWIAVVLGEPHRARATIDAALTEASRTGAVVGTDELWYVAASLALAAGDITAVQRCRREAEQVAHTLGTDRARMHCLAIQAALDPRGEAGREALRLARHLRQPIQLALVIDHLVSIGAADPQLLPEAYGLLGDADALLLRSWMRNLMRENNIPVPGRQSTVMENERLLAVLVAEGMGNKQIAMALRTSEKSVEGRLSRLFARTGHRSRVELAVAVLNGQFDA
ncbi:LuxR C-terminal-related transcriptional regulator [Kutzneria buriramensis]|uniref:Regulatory LuxR family protein n=1 Tax=Kutzneria buriramensis TaxID=1045776 RepID=A0A3E0G566_9PSEU|nr:helix-turn-helix transcriptional regulator [Kutzneria buriramensis]REH17970.1 regulatory LuxR family protein [Kutzneria buriramensis]